MKRCLVEQILIDFIMSLFGNINLQSSSYSYVGLSFFFNFSDKCLKGDYQVQTK